MNRFFQVLSILILLISCTHDTETMKPVKTGPWRATIKIQNQELPFNIELVSDASQGYDAYLRNAEERIPMDEVVVTEDSIDITLHIFDANIKAKIKGDTLEGFFIKNPEKDYKLPFRAVYGQTFRFAKTNSVDPSEIFTGKYSVNFIHDADTTEAIGVFNQFGDSITGTFLTPTGDYRYLEGNVVNGVMHLSTFDGNHAYLFRASRQDNGKLFGEFYSGKTFMAFWLAEKNENASLPDPESLTYLKEGYEKIEFNFPDVNGKKVTLNDEKYQNKVVILQLFGTWCPNCMDETNFLSDWYNENVHRGVEIIGLAYERKDDFEYASSRVKKMIEKLNVQYDFLIAGSSDKEKASRTLPMLNKVMAFPTTIFIGKDGKVKRIHTGFSGPGTGIYYQQLVEHFNETVNELLAENLASKNTSILQK